jgi:hypothetical protein
MKHYLVYRITGGVSLGEEEVEPHYRFIDEQDVKRGIVVPSSDPLIAHEPESEVWAKDPEEAAQLYREKRENAMM